MSGKNCKDLVSNLPHALVLQEIWTPRKWNNIGKSNQSVFWVIYHEYCVQNYFQHRLLFILCWKLYKTSYQIYFKMIITIFIYSNIYLWDGQFYYIYCTVYFCHNKLLMRIVQFLQVAGMRIELNTLIKVGCLPWTSNSSSFSHTCQQLFHS